jgi:hypothetical protein
VRGKNEGRRLMNEVEVKDRAKSRASMDGHIGHVEVHMEHTLARKILRSQSDDA